MSISDEHKDKKKHESKREKAYLTDRALLGAMIAINVILLQDLISLQKLDGYLHTTIITISISLPIFTGLFFLHDLLIQVERDVKETQAKRDSIASKVYSFIERYTEPVLALVGSITTLIGLGAAILHISVDAGGLFINCIGIAFLVIILMAWAKYRYS